MGVGTDFKDRCLALWMGSCPTAVLGGGAIGRRPTPRFTLSGVVQGFKEVESCLGFGVRTSGIVNKVPSWNYGIVNGSFGPSR